MDNINGALAFKATLDINDFNVSAQAMERSIKQVSSTAISEADMMDDSIQSFAQNGAKYIVSYLVGQGMGTLLQSIVQTRGQFQQLEIAFTTMLKSGTQAKGLMDRLIDTAAKTPFDLQGIAQTTKQMIAYGSTVDKVVDEIIMLGNVSSGVGAQLQDIAYLYGTLRAQGRAYTVDIKQFAGRGIPIYEELAKVLGVSKDMVSGLVEEGKVGFPEVEKAFQNMTGKAGLYFNLMQEQSKSLTGMISNMGDAWEQSLNKLGADNQDVFAGAIQSATYMAEHLDDILRILKAVAIGYGSVKAAIVLNTLATKGYTGVALLDNTARQAKISLMRMEAKLSGEAEAITKKMADAEKAHVAALQSKITMEQHEQALRKVRVDSIKELLTAEQKRYLSNLNLTSSSKEYLKEAESVLSAEQKMALSKLDLSTKGRAYAEAIEIMAKSNEQHLKSLKDEEKTLIDRESLLGKSRSEALARVEAARYEVYWAKQGNDTRRIENAERQHSVAVQRLETINTEANAVAKRKATVQTELNTIATRNNTAAGATDAISKGAQTAATNLLTLATTKLKNAMSMLWATMKANPIGWIVTAIGMAYTTYEMFFKKTEEALIGVKKATKSATEEFSKQAAHVDALRKIIDDGNASYDLRNTKLKELKKIIPGYNAELTKEGQIINDNTEAIKEYLTNLEKQIKLKAAQEELEDLYRQKRLKEKTKKSNEKDVADANTNLSAARFSASVNSQKLSTPGMKGLSTGMDMATRNAEDDLNRANKALVSTNKELEDIDNAIGELNEEINTVSSSMGKSTANAKSYAEQVDDARKNVATLTKELAELRSGKVEKDNLAKAIEDKVNDLNAAKRKLDTLTGNKTKANGDDNLSERQIEADRKLEADRIAVMEEGYEKRKRTLSLQHKEALDSIDKEEKALAKARKDAGKGDLSQSEKDGFNERRTIENKKYDKSQSKLFDGEIEYKKQQYALYFRWVRSMGEDVANTQFATLLKGGKSYKEYVENEIKALTEKQKAGTITEGESNHLISLNMQYNEITGAKSAMDAFKESVSKTIQQAQTLAEKLEAVAYAKERLANGSSGLVGADETAEATLFISEEDEKLQEEVQQKILSSYRTFEEQRSDIQKEYALLRATAQKAGDQERINQVNRAESEALSALNAQMLMQSESWKNLFSDLDSLTVEQIEKLIKDIQNKMNTADLNLNPADLNAVLDKLDEAKRKILDVNPFKAMSNALKDVFKKQSDGSKKTSKQIKTDWSNLAKATDGCFDFVNDAIDSCSVLGDLIGDTGKATIGMIQGVVSAGFAMSAAIKTAEKGSVILAAISIALQAIQWIAGLFNNDDELEEKIQNIQRNVDALSNSFDRLQHAAEKTYWVYSDEEAASHEKRVQAIRDEIAALEQQKTVALQSLNFVKYAQLTKQIKELKYALEKEESNGDMFQLYEFQRKNLKEQQELIKQQIAAEKDKKKTDWGKIQDWEEAIKDIDTQLEDMERDMLETLAGTDIKTAIDEFADALVDAYSKGGDAAEALGEKTKEILKKAVVEALKREFLAKGINDAVLYLGEAMKDGELTNAEKSEFEKLVNAAGNLFNTALEGVGDWIKDVEEEAVQKDPLTGAATSMSEETGGVIAGRLNAFVINQSDQTSIIRQALVYQAEIAANTKISAAELTEIKATLKRIENKDSSLLSQGIV